MKQMLLLCLLLVFIIGCTTSSGSMFKGMVSSERKSEKEASDKPKQDTDKDTEDDTAEESYEEPDYGIYIETTPSEADVYINSIYKGKTPLLLEDIKPGEYYIEISKDGYKQIAEWTSFSGDTRIEMVFYLEEETGFLSLSATPEDVNVHLGGSEISTGLTEYGTGTYILSVTKFGYEPFSTTVNIQKDRVTTIDVTLEKADFEIERVAISRKPLNPDNPGLLGTTTVTFRVTTYGSGTLSVYDSEQREVLTHRFDPFTSWEQEYRWDGSDNSGNPLPDGQYRIVITAKAKEGEKSVEKEQSIAIDRTATISYRSLLSGYSGLLFCPSSDVLPQDSLQLSAVVLGHMETIGTSLEALFPIQVGFRLSVMENLELAGQAAALLKTYADSPLNIGISAKYRLFDTGGITSLTIALSAKGTYSTSGSTDPLTNFIGFSAGIPVHASFGPVSILFMPDIIVSLYEVSYNESPSEGFYTWMYGRTGVMLDVGSISAGISAALRTRSFQRGFGIQWPLTAGAELHWLLPETQVILSGYITGEFVPVPPVDNRDPEQGFYLMGGIGLGFFN